MGYAGYAPGHRIADALPALEAALRALPLEKAIDTLVLIEKLVRNVVSNPKEEKFRRIRLTNPKIAEQLTTVSGAKDAMLEMGWIEEGENLILPSDCKLVFEKDVRAVQNTVDYFKTELEKEKKRQLAKRKQVDPDKEALLKQMELDRQEKEAQGPVTHGSKAQSLGNGANIMRASDIGIGKSAGG